MGLRLSFLEDEVIMFGLKALQKKHRKQIREAAAMEAQRLLSLSKQERTMQLRALLGPKGGLPRLKEELQKAAALLNTPLSPTATVDEIRKLLQPIVKDLIAKPNWEAPDVLRSSQVVVKAKAKPSAAPATTAQPQVINLASQDADEALRRLQELPDEHVRRLTMGDPIWDQVEEQEAMSETSFFHLQMDQEVWNETIRTLQVEVNAVDGMEDVETFHTGDLL